MSFSIVPTVRATPKRDDVLAGEPVLAPTQWTDVANGAMWLRGKGACLVPMHCPGESYKSSAERTFRFRVKPRSSAVQRVWTVLVSVEPGAGEPERCHVLLKAPAGTGTAVRGLATVMDTGTLAVAPQATTIVETLSARSSTEAEITIGIQTLTDLTGGTMATTVRIVGISCYEQDRPVLEDETTDQAVRIETVRPGEPILAADYTSLYGAWQALSEADPRRVGLFHFSSSSAITRSSATFLDLFTMAAKIQAPKVTRSTTTTAVKWSAYARSSTGATVSVRLSTASGVTDTMTFTSTSLAWGTARSISINCDDMSAADLLRDDTIQIAIAGSGVASVEFYAVSVWVEDVS